RSIQGAPSAPQRKTNPPTPPTSTYGPGPGGRGTSPPGARRTGPPGARDSGVVPPRPSAPPPAAEEDEPAPTVLIKETPAPVPRRTGPVPPQPVEEPPATVNLRAQRGAARPAAQPAPEEDDEDQSTVVLPAPPARRGAEPARGMSAMQRSASTRTPPPIPATQNIPVPPTPVPETMTAPSPVLAEGRRFPLTAVMLVIGLVVVLALAGVAAFALYPRP